MTRVIAVYVSQAGATNLAVGLQKGIWGFKAAQPAYQDLEVGDILVIGTGYSGGSPRVKAEEWMTHTLATVHVGVVTQTAYTDNTPVWPDEDGHAVSYPHRFRFDYRGSRSSVSLADDGPLGQDVSGGLRLSAVNKGWGYVFADPVGFVLPIPDGQEPDPDPGLPEGASEPQPVPLTELVSAFETELDHAGLQLPDAMALRFLCGLMAKPFVILAGLSGSGKTQLAVALGNWIGTDRTWVSAVRPDWTGAEALFGYENLLLPASSDGRAAWTVPAELQFMLRAADAPGEPHLLVLDEMNLAHVERYFADVLSGMESAWPVLPNLAQDDDGYWRQPAGADPRIPLPRNLVIVGTVNVDETTYQFSPKVLDRSTTIEFRVATGSLAAERPDLHVITPAPANLRRMLIDPPAAGSDDLPPTLLKEIHDLHELLADYGREFGHRSYQEMLRYGALALAARPSLSDDEILDHLVAQKVLPRIHGSARELAPGMAALAGFVGLSQPASGPERPMLPISADKLRRMQAELDATHFTAF